jgi:tetratricopeptide (TPR) repeat protein
MPGEKEKEARELFRRAYRFQMEGRLKEAEELYLRSIDVHPTAEAYTFLGWTYSFMKRLDDAIAQCLKAIETDPEFGNPYNDIGAYLIEQGRHEEAIPWLKKALLARRYECYFYAHYNLGRVYEWRGQTRDAMHQYAAALEKNANYDLARNALRKLQHSLN